MAETHHGQWAAGWSEVLPLTTATEQRGTHAGNAQGSTGEDGETRSSGARRTVCLDDGAGLRTGSRRP